MKFLPWDRLQLDSNIDGGQRVYKNQIFYKMYRTFAQKIVWSPLFLKNGLVLHGEQEDEAYTLINHLVSQNKNFKGASKIHLFDFDQSFRTYQDKEDYSFKYHPYPENIDSFFDELSKHINNLEEKTYSKGLFEPVNKRIEILVIPISDQNIRHLKDNTALLQTIKEVIKSSADMRIYPFFIASYAKVFPVELLKNIDWIAFLGAENYEISEKVFKKLEKRYRGINQKLIGSCYNVNNTQLAPLHPLDFAPSEWWYKKKETLEKEDKQYEEYLKSLDDGKEYYA